MAGPRVSGGLVGRPTERAMLMVSRRWRFLLRCARPASLEPLGRVYACPTQEERNHGSHPWLRAEDRLGRCVCAEARERIDVCEITLTHDTLSLFLHVAQPTELRLLNAGSPDLACQRRLIMSDAVIWAALFEKDLAQAIRFRTGHAAFLAAWILEWHRHGSLIDLRKSGASTGAAH